jgi:hypothetical protein
LEIEGNTDPNSTGVCVHDWTSAVWASPIVSRHLAWRRGCFLLEWYETCGDVQERPCGLRAGIRCRGSFGTVDDSESCRLLSCPWRRKSVMTRGILSRYSYSLICPLTWAQSPSVPSCFMHLLPNEVSFNTVMEEP